MPDIDDNRYRDPGPVAVAPNGEFHAAVWHLLGGKPGSAHHDDKVTYRKTTVELMPLNGTTLARTVELGEVVGHAAQSAGVTHLSFSPDSRRLALTYDGGFYVIDTATGTMSRLPFQGQGRVVTFSWRGSSRLVCSTDLSRLRLVECVVNDGPNRCLGVLDLQEPISPYVSEVWSPNGRYFAFVRNDSGRNLGLVDLADVTVHDLGQTKAVRAEVAWKLDESAMFCFTSSNAWKKPDRALLVSLPNGKVTDLSSEFERLVLENTKTPAAERNDNTNYPISMRGTWTADGTYVVVNSGSVGYLVSPAPWEVVPLGARIREELLTSGQLAQLQSELPETKNWGSIKDWNVILSPSAVSDWVWVRIGPGKWLVNHKTMEWGRCSAWDIVRSSKGLVCIPTRDACLGLPETIQKVLAEKP